MKFDAILEWFKTILEVAGPAIIIIFSLALFAGLLKWTARTKDNIKEVSKNPILLVLWIVISILLIYLFYKYAIPIFDKI
jgi:heme/copper-type cytochrome/quinol oxidase subunit 2